MKRKLMWLWLPYLCRKENLLGSSRWLWSFNRIDEHRWYQIMRFGLFGFNLYRDTPNYGTKYSFFYLKKRSFSLWLRFHHKHICEEPGCLKEGMKCHLVDYGDYLGPAVDVFNFYCTEHATQNGYCWMCGEFWAGNTEFDMEPFHLCPNCKSECEAETIKVDPETAAFFEEEIIS